jgi:hypothetical protein
MSFNQVVSEWKRISARIKSLRDANIGSGHNFSHKIISEFAVDAYLSITAFKDNFEKTLPLDTVIFLNHLSTPNSGDSFSRVDILKTVQSREESLKEQLALLSLIEGEVTYHLSDSQTLIRKNVEIAFLHLQRQLEIDGNVRRDWEEGWKIKEGNKNKSAENHFEKLGMAHFLQHKIWAFKADGLNGRTDAVLFEADIVDGAVLTEWKIIETVKRSNNYKTQIDKAKTQASKYAKGALGAVELSKYRYLVLVSKDYLKGLPEEVIEGDIVYKIRNIATNPKSPS